MYKFLSFSALFISTLTSGILISQVSVSQNSDCANYWINPNTNEQECLDSINSPYNQSSTYNKNDYNLSPRVACPSNPRFNPRNIRDLQRQELENFADALQDVVDLRINYLNRNREILKNEGVSIDEYKKYINNLDNKSRLQLFFERDELNKLNKVKNLIKENQLTDSRLRQVITERGLTHQRYCEIRYKVKHDRELQGEFGDL